MSDNLLQELKDIFSLDSIKMENLKTGTQEIISKPFYFIMRPIIYIEPIEEGETGKPTKISEKGIDSSIKRKINKIVENTDIPEIEGQFIDRQFITKLNNENIYSVIVVKYDKIITKFNNIIKPYYDINEDKSKLIKKLTDDIVNKLPEEIKSLVIYIKKQNIPDVPEYNGIDNDITREFLIYKFLIKYMSKDYPNKIMNDKHIRHSLVITSIFDTFREFYIENKELFKQYTLLKEFSKLFLYYLIIRNSFKDVISQEEHNKSQYNHDNFFKDFDLMPYMIFSIKNPENSTNDIIEEIKKSDTNNEFAYSIVSIKPKLTIKIPTINVYVPNFIVNINFSHFIKMMCELIKPSSTNQFSVTSPNKYHILILKMIIIYTRNRNNILKYILFYNNNKIIPIDPKNIYHIKMTNDTYFIIDSKHSYTPIRVFDSIQIRAC